MLTMWQELLYAGKETESNRQSHALWSKIISLVKKNKKWLYMYKLCLEGNTTNWQHWLIRRGTRWKQGHGQKGNLKFYAC